MMALGCGIGATRQHFTVTASKFADFTVRLLNSERCSKMCQQLKLSLHSRETVAFVVMPRDKRCVFILTARCADVEGLLTTRVLKETAPLYAAREAAKASSSRCFFCSRSFALISKWFAHQLDAARATSMEAWSTAGVGRCGQCLKVESSTTNTSLNAFYWSVACPSNRAASN